MKVLGPILAALAAPRAAQGEAAAPAPETGARSRETLRPRERGERQ